MFSYAASAQSAAEPLRIVIREGVIRPLSLAIPPIIAESSEATGLAGEIEEVMVADLVGTALFRRIPQEAYISGIGSFDAPPAYSDWKAINAEALVVASVDVDEGGIATVRFRTYDVFGERPLGEGLRFRAQTGNWRRIAHKIADEVYSRLTGETPYFDTRVAFIAETGSKQNRQKRLAMMDYGRRKSLLSDGWFFHCLGAEIFAGRYKAHLHFL